MRENKKFKFPFGTNMNMDAMQKELDYEIFVMEILEMDLYSKIIPRRLTAREKKNTSII